MKSQNPVEAALTDPRRRCLPLAARAIFDELVRLSDSVGNPCIRFADSIPKADRLAKIIACQADEIERAIAELVAIGLLEICKDGALAVVPMRKSFDRSRVNFANGVRGGRPPKGGK